MTPVTDQELFESFLREYPEDLVQLSRNIPEEEPYDTEAFSATSEYEGVLWEKVESGMLANCYDIPFLFSAKAFHYFFPAFIRRSQQDYERLELFVDSLVFFIADSNDDWSEKRWLEFSNKQLELVIKWLNWLLLKVDSSGTERIFSAINNIKRRMKN